jgi:hypothetical protein
MNCPCGNSYGFTSQQFLLAVLLLLLLGNISLSVVHTSQQNAQARDQDRLHLLATFRDALERYQQGHGFYPATTEEFDDWERSWCNQYSCTGIAAPFLEYLSTTVSPEPSDQFLYRRLPNGSYCLAVKLELPPSINRLRVDSVCDDSIDNETQPQAAWWYAIDETAR